MDAGQQRRPGGGGAGRPAAALPGALHHVAAAAGANDGRQPLWCTGWCPPPVARRRAVGNPRGGGERGARRRWRWCRRGGGRQCAQRRDGRRALGARGGYGAGRARLGAARDHLCGDDEPGDYGSVGRSHGRRRRARRLQAPHLPPLRNAVDLLPGRVPLAAAARDCGAAAQAVGGHVHAATHGAAVGARRHCALLPAARPLWRRSPIVDVCGGGARVAADVRGDRLLGGGARRRDAHRLCRRLPAVAPRAGARPHL
ncbi:hypothetical protein BU14_2684s0001 [Porphyra umbilicalis]|uniref:Uncharacterized protein n=1 Tax=Porphyra umbilicalis TaxID=2786 RepID=A0A1X6NIY0_PORUM|nr:hypothetical protein BU14_2684s0001 [Porphyra umbilicalis]|eukprot:OSX68500.1 hypothetical protein BU14_2684s0001 [Porphyra umbilicalis]